MFITAMGNDLGDQGKPLIETADAIAEVVEVHLDNLVGNTDLPLEITMVQ